MTVEIHERLEQLKSEWCNIETFNKIYGIDFSSKNSCKIRDLFLTWANSFPYKRECFRDNNKQVNRWLFELYLHHQNLLTARKAGIQLSMTKEDMIMVISKMMSKNMPISGWWLEYSSDIIDATFISNLSGYFPSLRYKLFNDRYIYIQSLHEVIAQDLDIPIKYVKPYYSGSTENSNESDDHYATEFDIITDKPFVSHQQVWLDFGKPISLKPDICSIFTYASHEQELKKYLFSPNSIEKEELDSIKRLLKTT